MAVRQTLNTLLPMLYLYFRSIYLFHVILNSCFSSGPFTGPQQYTSLQHVYHVTKVCWHAVHCFMYDLKATQMNVQFLVWDFVLYKFKLSHNGTESTKNICCEDTVDHKMVSRWFKEFHSGYKNQARSGWWVPNLCYKS